MKSFKALISKQGTILSVVELEEHQSDMPSVHILPGCLFPDVIYARADSKERVETKINDLLQKIAALKEES